MYADMPRLEKGYAVTERNWITLYGALQFPWQISLAPLFTFGFGAPATLTLEQLSTAASGSGYRS